MSPDKPRTYRFYCPEIPAAGEVTLSESEGHHARHVLRVSVGGTVTLFNGTGGRAEGRIATIQRRAVVVELVGPLETLSENPAPVHLAFAVPKGKRLDWLLEKASELGAASLCPVVFERSVAGSKTLSESQLARWQGHCIAAAKQCGAWYLPEISQPTDLGGLIGQSQGSLCIVGEAAGEGAGVLEVLAQRTARQPICLAVGPEGGLTEGERQHLADAGFISASVGATTLRIETAAIALLACASAKLP